MMSTQSRLIALLHSLLARRWIGRQTLSRLLRNLLDKQQANTVSQYLARHHNLRNQQWHIKKNEQYNLLYFILKLDSQTA